MADERARQTEVIARQAEVSRLTSEFMNSDFGGTALAGLEWAKRNIGKNDEVAEAIVGVFGDKQRSDALARGEVMDLGIDDPNLVNKAFGSEGRYDADKGGVVARIQRGNTAAVDIVGEVKNEEGREKFSYGIKKVDAASPIPTKAIVVQV